MMKNIKYILASILIISTPLSVNAAVDYSTTVGIFNTDAECRSELAKNDKSINSKAATGYYLSCFAISCGVNQAVTHEDVEPFALNVTCANGNPNPYKELVYTAIIPGGDLELNRTCSIDEQDEDFVGLQFATTLLQYNCLQTETGGIYNSTQNTQTTTTPVVDEGAVKNPNTSIDTYYLVLGSMVVTLSACLYVINKKNLFKKI